MDNTTMKRIEERAYQLFLARGGVHGYAMEDWIAAEKEIVGGSRPAAAKKPAPQQAAAKPAIQRKKTR